MALLIPLAYHGSPPRAWGQFWCSGGTRSTPGFTPTGVGTMLAFFAKESSYGGSPPRAWGQFVDAAKRLTVPVGSPPRAWGQYERAALDVRRLVGSPPRAWGQSSVPVQSLSSAPGSPPRAWGQCNRFTAVLADAWFTPTGVGTMSSPRMITPSSVTVHPHGRGDNAESWSNQETILGSPPRAWGQFVHRRSSHLRALGSPPRAWGQCLPQSSRNDSQPVHPHGRGDNDEFDEVVAARGLVHPHGRGDNSFRRG